jgi:ribosomal protein S27AE
MEETQRTRLVQHLEQKWTNKNCTMCGESAWNVPEEIYELREFHGGGLVVGPVPIVPVLPVTCSNCGNTVLINAIVAGVVAQEGGSND